MANIRSPGLGSGLDVNALVSQLVSAEAAGPTTRLNTREANLQVRLSGYGVFKSSISSFQSSLAALNTASTYTARSVTSSDNTVVSASTTGDAGAAAYDITVTTLAETQKLSTDPALTAAQFTETTDILGTGTLTFKFGTTTYDSGTDNYTNFVQNPDKASATVTISDGSLTGIRDAINDAKIGISASIINDGTNYRLTISANDTGAKNSIQITADDNDLNDGDTSGLSLLSFNATSNNLEQTSAAVDAALSINGINVTSASNSVSDTIENVTLTLSKTGSADISISQDNDKIKSAVQNFVTAYNQLVDTTKDLTGYDPNTKVAGTLNGDAVIRGISNSIRSTLGSPIGDTTDAFSILANIGITTDSTNGKLLIDDTKLSGSIANNTEEVTALFSAYATTTGTFVKFETTSSKTIEGSYAVNVTQLATQGNLTGTSAANLTIATGTNDTIVFDLNGTSASVILTAGTYTASSLAAEVQAQINNLDNFKNVGLTVSVTESAGVLSITSNSYGSVSKVSITGGNGSNDLLGSSPVSTDGLNIAGTIGGIAANGVGQTLTGASGNVEGLRLKVTGTTTGDRGSIDFKRGYADRVSSFLESLLDSEGILDSTTTSLQEGIERITKDREALGIRLENIEARIRRQFIALDTLISSLQNTSSFLTQQLDSLPTIGATRKK